MKDKIILAYYLDVGNLSPNEGEKAMHHFRKEMRDEDPNLIQYFMYVRGGGTRIECVYPKYIVSEELENETKEVLERLNKNL